MSYNPIYQLPPVRGSPPEKVPNVTSFNYEALRDSTDPTPAEDGPIPHTCKDESPPRA